MGFDIRPLSLGELLDRTFTLYRQNFLVFVAILAVPNLFLFATNVLIEGVQTALPAAAGGNPGALLIAALAFLLVMMVGLILFYFTYALSLAATVYAVADIYMNRPTSARGAYAQLRGKFGRIFDVWFSTGTRILLGLFLLIIPGILLAIRYAVTLPVALLEDLKAGLAMKRSGKLVEGSWGRVFLIYLLVYILSAVATLILQYPFAIAQAMQATRENPATWLGILSHMGAFLAGVLVGPLGTIAIVLLYYDERIRKEAFDLQMMMATADQSRVASTPTA